MSNLHVSSSGTATTSPGASGSPDLRLHGRWLLTARIGWGIIVLSSLLLFAFSIPAYAAQLQVICAEANLLACHPGKITPGNALALAHLGIARDDYIAYTLAITLLTSLVFLTVGAIIFWRKSEQVIGLFVSLLLIAWGCFGPTLELPDALAAAHPDWGVLHIISQVAFIFYPAVGVFFCIFPDGRFVPRWSWLLIGLWMLSVFYFYGPADFPFSMEKLPPVFLAGALLLSLGNGLGVQVYRYRSVSGPAQRQQTKWFVFLSALGLGLNVFYRLLGEMIPAFQQPDSLYQLGYATVTVVAFLLIPLAIGIAILRYHLWDIDTIINKALVYGGLSGILAVIYAGLIIGLESLAGAITGGQTTQQPLALVISTLAIAALFLPARRRIQALIDRRFYRKKYDADKTLAAFSAALRNEVDLEQVREQVIAVVQETMQPTHISLWLAQPERRRGQPLMGSSRQSRGRKVISFEDFQEETQWGV